MFHVDKIFLVSPYIQGIILGVGGNTNGMGLDRMGEVGDRVMSVIFLKTSSL